MLGNTAGALAQFVQKCFDIAILYFGAKLVIAGEMTVGQMVAFRMLSGRVSQPVMRLVQMWQDFQQTSLSIKRLGDIFHAKPEPALQKSQTRLPDIIGNIIFDKVLSFINNDATNAIENVTYDNILFLFLSFLDNIGTFSVSAGA